MAEKIDEIMWRKSKLSRRNLYEFRWWFYKNLPQIAASVENAHKIKMFIGQENILIKRIKSIWYNGQTNKLVGIDAQLSMESSHYILDETYPFWTLYRKSEGYCKL